MSSEPLPDHYKALGIDKNADAATIKKTYRKLVLTCHPDKVTDEALKAQKQDEFHKIQQAYETLSDETRRATYEAELKLQQLRREKLARTASGSTVEPKSARFAQPTSGGGSYTAHTSSRYATEERRPSGAAPSRHYDYEEDRYRGTSKGADSYFPSSSRRQSPRPSPSHRSSREKYEKESPRNAKTSDRTRSSMQKTRDSERRDRTGRFPVDSDGSSEEERAQRERERVYKSRTAEDESRRRAEEHRRDDRRDNRYDSMFEATSPRKLSVQDKENDAIRYISKSRAAAEIRPSPQRTASRDYYEPSRSSRHREAQPEAAPRRSSAKPRERPGMPSRRDTDRGIPDIVDWERPSFTHSASSPADIHVPPQRSATDSYRRADRSPPRAPGLNRSATMPTVPGSEAGGSRREAKSYPRPSGLRNEANSSPERNTYPTIPAPQSSSKTYYSYNPAEGGVKAMDPPPHRTILREPERTRHRSPSPLGRPPMGSNRPGLHTAKTYAPGRSSRQSSPVREERGRSERMKYGEMPSDYTRSRRMPERQASYSPHDVSYAPAIGPEDIRWASKRGDDRYTERKPTLSRHTTSVY